MVSDERIGRLLRASLPEVDWDQIERHLIDPSGDTPWPSFVSGVLLGCLFGVIVALALAPHNGRRTDGRCGRQRSSCVRVVRAGNRSPKRPSSTLPSRPKLSCFDDLVELTNELRRRLAPALSGTTSTASDAA